MGFMKDLEYAATEMKFTIVDEILLDKPRWEPHSKKDVVASKEPSAVKKLSAAFVSGFYATRNIQRAQFGMMHPMDMAGPRGGGFGPHGPGDGCEFG